MYIIDGLPRELTFVFCTSALRVIPLVLVLLYGNYPLIWSLSSLGGPCWNSLSDGSDLAGLICLCSPRIVRQPKGYWGFQGGLETSCSRRGFFIFCLVLEVKFGNDQKQSPEVFLKFRKIHRKTNVPVSFF